MGKKEETGIAPVTAGNLPDIYGEYADMGRDDVQIVETSILHVCQPLSPEVVEKGIAQVGDFVISPSDVNIGTEVTVVVPYARREWICWRDRKEGGGMLWRCPANRMDQMTDEQVAQTKWVDDQPPEASDTLSFACVEVDAKTGEIDPNGRGGFWVAYSKGSFKTGKRFATLRNHFDGPPIFAVFKLTSNKCSNDKGTWFEAGPEGVGGLRNPDTIQAVAKMHSDFKSALG